ncbi:maturation protein [ssRNA phage Gerhypos.1_48]|uniref:Maturation protein n=2 Tax=Fiersviridae TaxID=2842319 RepID=A0A8S5L266_9VIRU|nr:maturation protein [ssRNA phage Gerhypos.1_48]QDH90597.1 MAG: hypothetical protein H1Bulk30308_000003 [Leviviridae sp.]DAD51532.1 TPA_asm: maturation protein [ssRNA phage Gerhypos.1_48]
MTHLSPFKPGNRRTMMVMQSRFRFIPANRYSYDSDAIPDTWNTLISGDSLDALVGIVSVSGGKDRFHPHAQQLTHMYGQLQCQGSVISTRGHHVARNIGSLPYPVTSPVPSGDRDSAYNRAVSNLYEQIRGDLDLAVDIAEGHQTIDMLRSTGKALGLSDLNPKVRGPMARVFNALKSGAELVRSIKHMRSKEAANAWLQWTYGWKPAAQSLYGVVQQATSVDKPFHMIRATGRYKNSKHIQVYAFHGHIPTNQRGDISQMCMIQAEFAMSNSAAESLANYTSLNPLAIAWELVPYSFVVDWAIDIGGYLRAAESAFLYGNSFVRGFVTEGSKLDQLSWTTGSYTDSLTQSTDVMNFSGTFTTTTKRRQVLSENPFPRPPSLNLSLGGNRLISAASLLRQKL